MIEVINAGIYSSLQGQSRQIGLNNGIARGGVIDQKALALAHCILQSTTDLVGIEFVRSKVVLRILQPVTVVFAGGGIDWYNANGEQLRYLKKWYLEKDEMLYGRPSKRGFRSYLFTKRGFKCQSFAGSKSTDLKMKLGGIQRLLVNGDILFPELDDMEAEQTKKWFLGHHYNEYMYSDKIRVFEGPESSWLPKDLLNNILSSTWFINSNSDRMGLRLKMENDSFDSDYPISNMYSSTVLPGTVQLTPSGPIILMADAHTAGGYPRILQVCQVDLPILAQKAAGELIQFKLISWEMALKLKQDERNKLGRLRNTIQNFI